MASSVKTIALPKSMLHGSLNQTRGEMTSHAVLNICTPVSAFSNSTATRHGASSRSRSSRSSPRRAEIALRCRCGSSPTRAFASSSRSRTMSTHDDTETALRSSTGVGDQRKLEVISLMCRGRRLPMVYTSDDKPLSSMEFASAPASNIRRTAARRRFVICNVRVFSS